MTSFHEINHGMNHVRPQMNRNNRKATAVITVLVIFSIAVSFTQLGSVKTYDHPGKNSELIYTADFKKALDTSEWVTEIEPGHGSAVYTKNGKLWIDTKGGVTVWLKKSLKANVQIEYKRTVLMEGEPNDRLSDLNQFWMAEDPRNSKLFTRTGAFAQYDSLRLYYVGMGGNSNTTTRFRKYQGNGDKTLLQEYTDAYHLLKAGRTYRYRKDTSDSGLFTHAKPLRISRFIGYVENCLCQP
jgi:hypothetical protein